MGDTQRYRTQDNLSRGLSYTQKVAKTPVRLLVPLWEFNQTPSRHLHRAEDSQPRFRHAPVAAANQCSVATPHSRERTQRSQKRRTVGEVGSPGSATRSFKRRCEVGERRRIFVFAIGRGLAESAHLMPACRRFCRSST